MQQVLAKMLHKWGHGTHWAPANMLDLLEIMKWAPGHPLGRRCRRSRPNLRFVGRLRGGFQKELEDGGIQKGLSKKDPQNSPKDPRFWLGAMAKDGGLHDFANP